MHMREKINMVGVIILGNSKVTHNSIWGTNNKYRNSDILNLPKAVFESEEFDEGKYDNNDVKVFSNSIFKEKKAKLFGGYKSILEVL